MQVYTMKMKYNVEAESEEEARLKLDLHLYAYGLLPTKWKGVTQIEVECVKHMHMAGEGEM